MPLIDQFIFWRFKRLQTWLIRISFYYFLNKRWYKKVSLYNAIKITSYIMVENLNLLTISDILQPDWISFVSLPVFSINRLILLKEVANIRRTLIPLLCARGQIFNSPWGHHQVVLASTRDHDIFNIYIFDKKKNDLLNIKNIEHSFSNWNDESIIIVN